MNNVLKASAVFIVGVLSSCIAGFIYGWVGYNFDLFLIFPFIVVAIISSASVSTAVELLYGDKKILFVMGIVFGVIAYFMHTYGGYIAFTSAVRQQILQVPQNRTLSPAELNIFTNQAIHEILQKSIGITGPIGWLIFRTNASIAPFYASNQGQRSYVAGALVELFKCGCLTIVTGIILRESTGTLINIKSDVVFQAKLKQQKQEERAKRKWDKKRFRTIVVITLIIAFTPLLFFIISLFLY